MDQRNTHRAQNRERVTQALDRVRHAARQRKKERFTALLHHVNVDTLRMAFHALKRDARPRCGWHDVGGLRGRPRAEARGPARPGPAWSVSAAAVPPDGTPKADGRQRPLAIAALEDKIARARPPWC